MADLPQPSLRPETRQPGGQDPRLHPHPAPQQPKLQHPLPLHPHWRSGLLPEALPVVANQVAQAQLLDYEEELVPVPRSHQPGDRQPIATG